MIAPLDVAGEVQSQGRIRLDCDLIALSVAWAPDNGLLYQAGCDIAYNHDRNEFMVQTFADTIYAAGRVMGCHDLANEVADGRLAGATSGG